MADELRFLCDEMLAGLGRWLRIAGYDTAIASGGRRDRDLVKQAHAEQRILLTRDRRVVEIRPANDRTVVLENDGIDACAKELGQRLSLDWTLDPLSRCTLCNARLERADHRLLESLPSRIRALGSTVQLCPCGGRLYWEGSHVRRIRRRLAIFASQRLVKELSKIKSSIVPTRRFDPTCCLVQPIAPVRSNMVSSHRAVITSFRRM